MKIGYARVSTQDQNLGLQLDALKTAGCEKIFKEKESGGKTDRPELLKMLEQVREGDIVVVWKLDRLGRSLKHLIEIVNELHERKVQFVSLKETIDTTSATGKLIFNIFASFAEFEKDMIRERTKAGLANARRIGKTGGRPKGLSEESKGKAETAKILYESKSLPITSICQQLDISKATLYKLLRSKGIEIGK
ncbi:recombinase family protein [Runella slithyformis]|uniref:Resolvase domain protein n=1 Tax=Runella slithyformis (strain ATCC 29530 / DSM 19594 / LMG 11500 / NCIMB 11436 / LSU 4) TaxID=761193 RepID=A0A7U3ZN43_RUNSL|nr:recombinase family protein [Runella slithyformis]AEI50275.1 Resolvase domain protein [Runella slithyformis DSM 19594]